ncbi:MAG: hypothetical protein COZ53_04210 [Candidatus Altarchaeum sp. CG_4_8_14_3_um_filter_33_2054]|nr:MAG: hypothetical protein COZ53_04210 [Candidatus Altarchaeum sp. CG_4_8_14_3_um_filter_33_2054]
MDKTNKNKVDIKIKNNADNTVDEFVKDKFREAEGKNNFEESMPDDKIKSLAEKFISQKKDAILDVAKDYPKKNLMLNYAMN